MSSAIFLNYFFNLSYHDVLRHYHTKVTVYSRELGNSFVLTVKCSTRYDLWHIDHCDVCSLSDSVDICNIWMYFTQISDYGSIVNDISLTSRMQECLACIWIVSLFLVQSDLVKELFYDTLHAEKVAFSVHTQSELHTLIRKFC